MLHLTNISGENRITLENAFNCGLFCLSSDTHSELPAWPQLTYRLWQTVHRQTDSPMCCRAAGSGSDKVRVWCGWENIGVLWWSWANCVFCFYRRDAQVAEGGCQGAFLSITPRSLIHTAVISHCNHENKSFWFVWLLGLSHKIFSRQWNIIRPVTPASYHCVILVSLRQNPRLTREWSDAHGSR